MRPPAPLRATSTFRVSVRRQMLRLSAPEAAQAASACGRAKPWIMVRRGYTHDGIRYESDWVLRWRRLRWELFALKHGVEIHTRAELRRHCPQHKRAALFFGWQAIRDDDPECPDWFAAITAVRALLRGRGGHYHAYPEAGE